MARRSRSDRAGREQRVELRRAGVPALSYPEQLPVSQRRDEIAEAVRDHQVVIVAGETGSGKTTQLPKICLGLGRGVAGMIGHTQPRRLAARTVADRLASELGVELGTAVGYAVRFTDQVGEATNVKLMTDGILLAELRHDRRLEAYDTIIVDEAHERSLNIDFLLGYLAQLLPRRPDLKVIITSATIETQRFSDHFGGAPVIEVTGRSFPVEMRYRPLDEPTPGSAGRSGGGSGGSGSGRDQIGAILDAVAELRRDSDGDILVFLSGEREIRDTADALRELDLPDTDVLPLYARLSMAEQHRVFAAHTRRRVVLATNVAETSLTVPGVRCVIDPGTARISRYSTRLKVQRLPIEAVSQASANQRAGRCGRVADGICIRLYSQEDFESRPEFTEPEILRTNLASVILAMTGIGLGDIGSFPFVDPPDRRAVADGVRLLDELRALERTDEPGRSASGPSADGRGLRLTDIGRRLARLPVDPRLGRMVLEAERNGCVREVLIVASALSVQDPRERPTDQAAAADQLHARFADPTSDFLAYLQLWAYLRETQHEVSSSAFRRRCRREHLNFLRIREWQDVHAQLRRVVSELGVPTNRQPADPDLVHRSVLAGLLSHIGQKNPESREYLGARGARFALFPGSTVARKPPDWVMAAELVETSRLWGRTAARIQPEWAEELGDHLVKRNYSEPHWSTRQGAAMVHEKVTLYGLPIVADRLVGYSRIDPEHARELFIRHALVEGEWTSPHRFIAQNRALLDELGELEARFRRDDLVADLDSLERLYDERVPAEVVSGRHFDRWWKDTRRGQPDLLTFGSDDLLSEAADELDERDFPAEWHQGDLSFGLSYAFEPGTTDDGVAVHIDVARLAQVEPVGFDWQVPGLRVELIGELIRSLPKSLRRGLVPVPETVQAFLDRVEPGAEPLLDALERELGRVGGERIRRRDWNLEALAPHLRMLFLVVDEHEQVLAQGEDLIELKARLAGQVRQALAEGGTGIERGGLTDWEVGTIPRQVEVVVAGREVTGYPALVDEGQHVALRVLDTVAAQDQAHWDGVRRLLALTLPRSRRGVQQRLDNAQRLALGHSPYPSAAALIDDCVLASLDELMVEAGAPVWDGEDFVRLRRRVTVDLDERVHQTVVAVTDVLARWAALDRPLEALSGVGAAEVRADVVAQRDGLVYDGFVLGVGRDRLADLARYLEAAAIRLDKRRQDPSRDGRLMAAVHQLQRRYDRLFDQRSPAEPGWDQVLDIAWMIEELRVSLFAQTLGTNGPTSAKRVLDAIESATD
jgi:ATP-dependent helicase HrpA